MIKRRKFEKVLKHDALCILHKADPSTMKFSKVDNDDCDHWSIMVPGWKKVLLVHEFHVLISAITTRYCPDRALFSASGRAFSSSSSSAANKKFFCQNFFF